MHQKLDWECELDRTGLCAEPDNGIQAACSGRNAASQASDCSTLADFCFCAQDINSARILKRGIVWSRDCTGVEAHHIGLIGIETSLPGNGTNDWIRIECVPGKGGYSTRHVCKVVTALLPAGQIDINIIALARSKVAQRCGKS